MNFGDYLQWQEQHRRRRVACSICGKERKARRYKRDGVYYCTTRPCICEVVKSSYFSFDTTQMQQDVWFSVWDVVAKEMKQLRPILTPSKPEIHA